MVVLSFHTIIGGVALLVGPFQFPRAAGQRYPAVHQATGRLHVGCVLVGSGMSLGSAVVSTSGLAAVAKLKPAEQQILTSAVARTKRLGDS